MVPLSAESPYATSFRFQMLETQADLEDLYRVDIDQVIKVNAEVDENLETLVSAERDVMSTAVRVDGARRIDVFTELEDLTPREREVVALIARGYEYREISEDLGISQKTLETHMRNVFDKLGVASRSEVTRLAFETGFARPGD
ncbi:MAG TPA: helix-turn-helix transcriptional regulator [Acidimicrobiia bacterium]|nr:helix-turn-helix transcriptional regulator [Acidimicrobiia bacterium]